MHEGQGRERESRAYIYIPDIPDVKDAVPMQGRIYAVALDATWFWTGWASRRGSRVDIGSTTAAVARIPLHMRTVSPVSRTVPQGVIGRFSCTERKALRTNAL